MPKQTLEQTPAETTPAETRAELYTALAGSLEYPGPRWRENLQRCHELVSAVSSDAAELLVPLLRIGEEMSDTQLEEFFTRTFDHSPSHALEIGWHLFGEDYHRGALLVRLRQELRKHNVPESVELPDHLSHVLILLGRMRPADALSFAQSCVSPAVRKTIEGLERDESDYLGLIQCISAVIDQSSEHAFEEIHDGRPIETS